jgi:hypothetical protein
MHGERFAIPPETAAAVVKRGPRAGGWSRPERRWFAPSKARRARDGRRPSGAAETTLFITPGFRFRVVDALLTNFHLPQSTLLVLVTAFAGYDRMRAAYAQRSSAITDSFRSAMRCSQSVPMSRRRKLVMADTPILEISRLEEIFEDDTAGIADLLDAAMGTGATNQATLRDALGRRSLDDVMRAAHAIKGSYGKYRRQRGRRRRGAHRDGGACEHLGRNRTGRNRTRPSLRAPAGSRTRLSSGIVVNSPTISTTPNKVLVVDDVQTNLTVFAKVVAQIPETEAVCFTSAKEALTWLGQNEAC